MTSPYEYECGYHADDIPAGTVVEHTRTGRRGTIVSVCARWEGVGEDAFGYWVAWGDDRAREMGKAYVHKGREEFTVVPAINLLAEVTA